MELEIFRQFQYRSSMIGWIDINGSRIMTLERRWNDNIPGQSCVPAGFYHLVPHNGQKYKNTWALVGETVSHLPGEGKIRSACVLHWEDDAAFLHGCTSFGYRLGMVGDEYKLFDNCVPIILGELDNPGPHYLRIHDPMRGPYTCKS
jgi:hypothetical protein